MGGYCVLLISIYCVSRPNAPAVVVLSFSNFSHVHVLLVWVVTCSVCMLFVTWGNKARQHFALHLRPQLQNWFCTWSVEWKKCFRLTFVCGPFLSQRPAHLHPKWFKFGVIGKKNSALTFCVQDSQSASRDAAIVQFRMQCLQTPFSYVCQLTFLLDWLLLLRGKE